MGNNRRTFNVKRALIIGEGILLLIILLLLVQTTYTFLTDKHYFEHNFTIGEVKIDVQVETNDVNDLVYNLDSIAYIDLLEFTEPNNLTNIMATDITVNVTNKGDVAIRNKVEIGMKSADEIVDIPGLIWLVLPNDVTDFNGYIAPLITGLDTSDAIRDAIHTANNTFLKEMYEAETSVCEVGETVTFKVVFWGDYYGLTDTTNYLSEVFNFTIRISAIQNLSEYGGVPSYETD